MAETVAVAVVVLVRVAVRVGVGVREGDGVRVADGGGVLDGVGVSRRWKDGVDVRVGLGVPPWLRVVPDGGPASLDLGARAGT